MFLPIFFILVDDSVVPLLDGCGACGVSLGTTAPTCAIDVPTRCQICRAAGNNM